MVRPPVETADLTGKAVMVVGANTGIGLEAATHFARMNPSKLFLACRSESKGKAAISKIKLATGFKSCELCKVDFAELSSVIRFADEFRREHDRLDILVMNAGLVNVDYLETVDGWEESLQVNHLATSLLSLLLLPLLVDTGKRFGSASRLVIVSCAMHHFAVIPKAVKDSPSPVAQLESAEPGHLPYPQSKLLNILFARALHDRLRSNAPVTVNAVAPGFCNSDLLRNVRGVALLYFWILKMALAWTCEQGGRQLVYAAVGERDHEDHMKGAYVGKAKVEEPSDFVLSEEGKTMQNNVWRETVEILTRTAPRLNKIIGDYLV